MDRLFYIFSSLIFIIFLHACSLSTPVESERELSQLSEYQVEKIQYNYFGTGRILIKNNTKRYSGSFELSISKREKMQLRLSHPIGGSIAIIFVDENIIQVLNQNDREFFQKVNDGDWKLNDPLLLDMEVAMWQSIFWGRKQKIKTAEMEYSFKNTKPTGLVLHLDKRQIKVEYNKWMELDGILIPKSIIIKDDQNDNSVKFVLLEVIVPKEQKLEQLIAPESFLIKNEFSPSAFANPL